MDSTSATGARSSDVTDATTSSSQSASATASSSPNTNGSKGNGTSAVVYYAAIALAIVSGVARVLYLLLTPPQVAVAFFIVSARITRSRRARRRGTAGYIDSRRHSGIEFGYAYDGSSANPPEPTRPPRRGPDGVRVPEDVYLSGNTIAPPPYLPTANAPPPKYDSAPSYEAGHVRRGSDPAAGESLTTDDSPANGNSAFPHTEMEMTHITSRPSATTGSNEALADSPTLNRTHDDFEYEQHISNNVAPSSVSAVESNAPIRSVLQELDGGVSVLSGPNVPRYQ